MAKDDVFDQQTLEQVLNAIAQYCETMLLDSNVDEVATYDEKKMLGYGSKAYHEAYRVLCGDDYASLALPANMEVVVQVGYYIMWCPRCWHLQTS